MRRYSFGIDFPSFGHRCPGIALSQQTTVSLQGVVVRDASGDPLSKARVELRGGPLEATTQQRKATDAFTSPISRPGAYEISVRRDGFAPAEVGQKWPGGPGVPIQVRPGQPVPELTVRMVAAASISGRVADSNGQPIAKRPGTGFEVDVSGRTSRPDPGPAGSHQRERRLPALWASRRPLFCECHRARDIRPTPNSL